MTQNKRKVKEIRIYFILGIMLGLIMGIFIGIVIEQIIIVNGIERAGESWEGIISNMNIEIDINETKLVEATYEIFPGELNDTKE